MTVRGERDCERDRDCFEKLPLEDRVEGGPEHDLPVFGISRRVNVSERTDHRPYV